MDAALPYDCLPGAISKQALADHVRLWSGYAEAYQRVQTTLQTTPLPDKHAPDDPFRVGLNVRGYAANGDRLHAFFFGNLTNHTTRISLLLEVEGAIERKWGGKDEVRQLMRAATLVARGWALLVWDRFEKDLRVIVLDGHDQGLVVGCDPLLVIDAYEHAYWMDHGTDKAGYFDALWPYVNWPAVNQRFLANTGK